MRKLQQFNILSLNYDRIKNNNSNIVLSISEAELNCELISVADNEVLRAIRRITKHKYNRNGYQLLRELTDRKNQLKKEKNNIENQQEIKRINTEIKDLLYIPDYLCVTFPSGITKKAYNSLNKNGFVVNGIKYKWLLCGASHQRTNRAFYCNETIFDNLWEILSCGAKNIEILPAKYNAYFALSASASNYVSEPKVCVVPDCEIEMTKKVDWVSVTQVDNKNSNYNIDSIDKNITFNLFDGMGIISPEQAEKWSRELKLKYLPSCWCIRSTFIKGMVCVFDFKKFARDVANKEIVTDIWGNEVNINEVDIILTKSQFKLWNAYNSWQDYCEKHNKYKLSWGVTKITPEKDDDYTLMNYQYLQVLNIDNEDIKQLCKNTVDWFKGISGKSNYNYKLLYLLGKLANNDDENEIWNRIQDNTIKSLLLNTELIHDPYINQRIVESIRKKITESYIGKIIVNGNYQTRIKDPYGLVQHIFGMKVTGLLQENEHYMYYWQDRNVKRVVAMRSPLTWRSEAHILNIVEKSEKYDWYKYLTSGIVYNLWGCDDMLEADADYDMDCTCTTDNEIFIKGVLNQDKENCLPITYSTLKPAKEKVTQKKLSEVSFWGFDTKIGQITNDSTTVYVIQSNYEKNSLEYKELQKRLKLFRYFQGNEIDRAKNGYKAKKIPKEWNNYKTIKSDMSESEIESITFNNKILIEKRPYFMRYLYPKYDKEYKCFMEDFDRYAKIVYGKSLKDLESDRYSEFMNYYNYKNPFLCSDSVMNNICRFMEENTKDIKLSVKNYSNDKLFNELYNEDILLDNDKLNLINNLFTEYNDFKKSKQLVESDFADYEQYYKYLRNKALTEISSDIKELANLSVYLCYKLYPKNNKEFCWNVFSSGIYENIKIKNNIAKIPLLNKDGEIDYLGKHYTIIDYNVDTESIDVDTDYLFEGWEDDII